MFTTGAELLTLEIVAVTFFVPETPSLSVKLTGIVTVPLSDVIEDALLENTIVFVETLPANPLV